LLAPCNAEREEVGGVWEEKKGSGWGEARQGQSKEGE